MGLPDSYTVKPGSIPAYLEALLNAEAPERFTIKFLENLEFKSTNDRLLVGVLKDLGFIDTDGIPTQRYFEFLDRSQSGKILAESIRDAYSDLFAVNKSAHTLSIEETKNKLRTLYAGSKKDNIIGRIASTFNALCEVADFDNPRTTDSQTGKPEEKEQREQEDTPPKDLKEGLGTGTTLKSSNISLDSLQYHINIILPESRDQAVYDAIFKSLKAHLR